MSLEGTNISCGVHQYAGLSNRPTVDVDIVVDEIFADYPLEEAPGGWDYFKPKKFDKKDYTGPAFVIFSDTEKNGNGNRLAKYIRKNKLGTVHKSSVVVNPGSGNKIALFTWKLNIPKLYKLWKV